MPKIVKTFVVTEPSLLQSVAEASWLDAIKNRAGLGDQKPADQAPAPKQELPSVTKVDPQAEADNPLGHVVSSILQPISHDRVRVALHMSQQELTTLFLTSDKKSHFTLAMALLGHQKSEGLSLLKSIALIEDPATGEPNDPDSVQAAQADLRAAAGSPAAKAAPKKPTAPKQQATTAKQPSAKKTNKIVALRPGYKFSELIANSGDGDCTVLLDVATPVYSQFQKATGEDKVNLLAQMFDHRNYYIATISNSRSAKIAKLLDQHKGNLDQELASFDPSIIVNYPQAQTIKQAKIAWNEKYAEQHEKLLGHAAAQVAAATASAAPPAPPAEPVEKPEEKDDRPLTTSKLKAAHDTLLALARTMPLKGSQGGSRKELDKALNVIKQHLSGASLPT